MAEFKMRESLERMEEIKARQAELAEVLKTRDLTDAEQSEDKLLEREFKMLDMKVRANTPVFTINKAEDIPSVALQMREAISNGQRFEVKVRDEAADSDATTTTAYSVPNKSGYANPAATTRPDVIYTEQIVAPLYEQSILGKIGVAIKTGLTGNHVYPVVEAFAASVEEEGVALGDTTISTSKLYAKPERCAVAVPITRQALNETEGLLKTIFTQYAPAAVAELQNKIICSTSAVNKATNLVGPFVSLKSGHSLTYAKNGSISAADLQKLIAKVANNKVQMANPAFIMNIANKGALEITPMWSGAAKAVIENDKFAGIPVVTCTDVPAGTVLFGDFKYYPLDIFGNFNIIIDPYSKARNGAVDCILDFDMAGTVLRKEAFATLTESAT